MTLRRFLIASLHVKALQDCDTIRSIKRVVDTLPADLNELYARTIERIRCWKGERASIGLMALLWVVHAKRPLELQELQQLLATDYAVGSFALGTFNADGLPEKNIILASTCGLLIVDSSGVVRLMRECAFASSLFISNC